VTTARWLFWVSIVVGITGLVLVGIAISRKYEIDIENKQQKTKASEEKSRLIKLEKLLSNIETEFERLRSEAIQYPLSNYEEQYLLSISDYTSFKKRCSKKCNNNDIIFIGLMDLHINPLLTELEKKDEKVKMMLNEIKNIRERIDANLSMAVGRFIEALECWETVRILYEIHIQKKVTLSARNINLFEKLDREAKEKFVVAKRILYEKIDKLKRKA